MYTRSNRSNRLTRFNRSNLTEEQQLKKKLFHPNNLTVAKGWFSLSGLEGGERIFYLLPTIKTCVKSPFKDGLSTNRPEELVTVCSFTIFLQGHSYYLNGIWDVWEEVANVVTSNMNPC